MEFVKKIKFGDTEIDIEIANKGEIVASGVAGDEEMKGIMFIIG